MGIGIVDIYKKKFYNPFFDYKFHNVKKKARQPKNFLGPGKNRIPKKKNQEKN